MATIVLRLAANRYVRWSTTDSPVSPVLDRRELATLLAEQEDLVASAAEALLA